MLNLLSSKKSILAGGTGLTGACVDSDNGATDKDGDGCSLFLSTVFVSISTVVFSKKSTVFVSIFRVDKKKLDVFQKNIE